MIDFLAAEIPEMNGDIFAVPVFKGAVDRPGLDVDTFGGIFFSCFDFVVWVHEFFHESGFSHIALSHQ